MEQAAGKSSRQVMRLLAEVDPELAVPADRVRPLGAGRWELKTVIDDECRRGLERLKGLLSHVDPHMTLGQIVARLVQEGLDRHDPARPPRGRRTGARAAGAERTSAAKTQTDSTRGAPSAAKGSAQAAAEPGDEAAPMKADRGPDRPDTSEAKPAGDTTSAAKTRHLGRQAAAGAKPAAALPRTETSAAKAGGATSRAIPAAVKRAVWRRDRGRCSYVDRTSRRRCGSQHLLQIDHVVPYARGGAAEPNNLRLLCAAHHRHRHAGTRCGGGPGDDHQAPVPFSPAVEGENR